MIINRNTIDVARERFLRRFFQGVAAVALLTTIVLSIIAFRRTISLRFSEKLRDVESPLTYASMAIDRFGRSVVGRELRNEHALYVEIRRRRHDGLLLFRPINWTVYYDYGGDFYHVVSKTSNSTDVRCGEFETPALVLKAERFDDGDAREEVSISELCCVCLKTTLHGLIDIFSIDEEDVTIVSLDDLVKSRGPDDPPFVVTDALNYLAREGLL